MPDRFHRSPRYLFPWKLAHAGNHVMSTPAVRLSAVPLVEVLKTLGRRRRDFDERHWELQDRLQSDEPPDEAEVEAMLDEESSDPLPALARRLEELTGIPADDWVELACRLPTAIGAGPYSKADGSKWRDLRHLLAKLYELDCDGKAARLIADFAKRIPEIATQITDMIQQAAGRNSYLKVNSESELRERNRQINRRMHPHHRACVQAFKVHRKSNGKKSLKSFIRDWISDNSKDESWSLSFSEMYATIRQHHPELKRKMIRK
jgi:hypothetical protein